MSALVLALESFNLTMWLQTQLHSTVKAPMLGRIMGSAVSGSWENYYMASEHIYITDWPLSNFMKMICFFWLDDNFRCLDNYEVYCILCTDQSSAVLVLTECLFLQHLCSLFSLLTVTRNVHSSKSVTRDLLTLIEERTLCL